MKPLRHLVLVLGDQLDPHSAAFDGFDRHTDAVWMAEVSEESTHVWSHKARIALFLAAMRHFRDHLRSQGRTVHYQSLDAPQAAATFRDALRRDLDHLRPTHVIVLEPGEWRVREALTQTALQAGVPLEVRPDRHFLCSASEFAQHAQARRQLRLEFFYREMRRRHHVLMEEDQPAGGTWNFDAANRESFSSTGPGPIAVPCGFPPDAGTREVIALVEARFPQHPGQLTHFDWPVTPDHARKALDDFITHRLPHFGRFQDALWAAGPTPEPTTAFLHHSRLAAALNLKLLDPRLAIRAAEQAWQEGHAPLPAAEGFIRQILGWREYVRGIYGQFMPGYRELNALEATAPLPGWYWTGDTDLHCLRQVLQQTLAFGYAHHIQRLMVTGLFALLLGVQPLAVHAWYLAVYVDAVEWVELPNTLGMALFADGGLLASKPYVATGQYLQRMSNYCAGCRYDPKLATGDRACPFTTLYWDFLARHEARLRRNPRMAMQLRNLARLADTRRAEIRREADRLRGRLGASDAPAGRGRRVTRP